MSLEGSISIHRASCCFLIWKLPVCVTPKLILFLLVTRQQHAAKAYSRYIMTNKLNATFVATLLQCAAATTSALLQGLWPTNPFTPRKHKPINTFCREPDNPPLSTRVSSFIYYRNPIPSFLFCHQTDKHSPWPLAVFINMSNGALTSDRWQQGHSGGSQAGWSQHTERSNGQMAHATWSNGPRKNDYLLQR